MNFSSEFIETGGCRIALHRAGAGEPMLYLHGTEGLVEWPAVLGALARDYAVIAPDHPAYGESDVPDWLDDISDVAYIYLDLLEELGLSGVHVVGHSVGGWIALEMAVRSRDRLRSLTLIASAGIHVKGHSKADIFMIDPEELARMLYVDPKRAEAASQRALEDKHQDVVMRNRVASALLGWHPRFFNPRLQRWLGRVRVPVHIVWGQQDRIIPAPYAEAFHELLPDSRLTVIPDAGHMPHIEREEPVLEAMESFLSEITERNRS